MKLRDLFPMLPHEGPPLPRFMMSELPTVVEKPLEKPSPEEKVTTAQTVAYQNRELAKTLLSLETHLSQGCRIAGKPCDCCSGRHPLELEKLSEEATSMTSDPIYKEIIGFAREVEMKANESAIRSGAYDTEYPKLAIRARGLRKKLVEQKARQVLDLIKQGKISLDA